MGSRGQDLDRGPANGAQAIPVIFPASSIYVILCSRWRAAARRHCEQHGDTTLQRCARFPFNSILDRHAHQLELTAVSAGDSVWYFARYKECLTCFVLSNGP